MPEPRVFGHLFAELHSQQPKLTKEAKSGWLLKIYFVFYALRISTQEMSVGKRRENTNYPE